MILKRGQIMAIGNVIAQLKEKTNNAPISVRYKILKLEMLLQQELTISQTLMTELYQRYAEIDESGKIITNEEGAIKIQADKIDEVCDEFNKFYDQDITIPDYRFTLDELEVFDLDWNSLAAFMPLITD